MNRRSLLVIAAAIAIAAPLSAQVPSPDTSMAAQKEMIQQQIKNGADVKEQIRKSGLTAEQIRGKLKAAGMSESSLDSYLSGAAGGTATPTLPPTPDVLAAVALLNAADSTAQNAATAKPLNSPLNPQGNNPNLPQNNNTTNNLPITEGGLPVFGLDIFRRGSNQFEPNAVGPVDANYRLGPLDMVAVILTGETELSHSLEVTRDGFIVIPQVGQVFVANLTLAQATQVIVQKLRTAYAGAGTGANASTRVYVTVARLRSNQIFVIGEVASPGSYQVSAAGTVLTALYAAGGPTVNGTVRNILVRRGGNVISTVDLYAYLLRGDASGDIRLETGDMIFVAANPKHVAITGEVARPAVYELKQGETLEELTQYAGGLKSTAARARVQISRVLPPAERLAGGRDRTVIDVVGDPESDKGLAARTPLQPSDRVTVFPVSERVRNRLVVTGSVWGPGTIAYRPGMHLSEALSMAGGVRPDTYLDAVQISRLLPNDQREQVSAQLDRTGKPVNDIVISDEDSIHVFSINDLQTQRTVHISGAVRKQTDAPWHQGISLRDMVLLAGGFESDQDAIDTVSITRLNPDLSQRSFITPLRDSTGRYSGIPLDAGDVIRTFSRTQFRPTRYIRVGGAVRAPLDLPYADGMTLRQAILLAGGLDQSALLTHVQVSRVPTPLQVGKLAFVIEVPLDSSYVFERSADGSYSGLQGVPASPRGAADFLLKPYDQVNVLRQPEWDYGGTITLTGEVKFPGAYALLRRDETISEVIARAGGVTDRAFPLGAVFTRKVSPEDVAARRRLMDQVRRDRAYGIATERLGDNTSIVAASLPPGAASNENKALNDVLVASDSGAERIAIDLPKALDGESRDNLIVRTGDSLFIPILNPTVTVRGFVGSPATIPYHAGMDIRGYINLAGGPTVNADVDRSIVHQPNGQVEVYKWRRFLPDDSPVPLPGSVIVVPPLVPNHGESGFFQALTAFASFATAAVAIISVARR